MIRLKLAGACLGFIIASMAQLVVPMQASADESVSFQVEFVADEMCCNGCAQKIAAQLYAAPGVTSVEADVPNRLLKVKAKASPKLTLERLWHAVEQGKGAPSKLITTQATYVLTRPEQIEPQQRLPEGQYSLVVGSLNDKDQAQNIANSLYKVRGVNRVSVDAERHTLFVQSIDKEALSPWQLAMSVQNAGSNPLVVSGPYGTLTIDWANEDSAETAARQDIPQRKGEIR